MSQDDDVNEKALDAAVHALVRHGGTDPNDEDGPYSAFVETMTPPVRAAITAYLSALPERELLAEALEALDGVIRVADRKTVEFDAARAAADKIRDAMGGGNE